MVEDVYAGYDGSRVLEGVSLRIERGETVVLLGPNGHGKTTLAKTISGVIRPTSGRVVFEGVRVDGMDPAAIVAAGIVHIPQGDLLFPEMTVVENLLAAVAHSRIVWRDRQRRIDEVLELFPSLKARASQQAGTLSGGERRMLALGRGLMVPSSLLIVDEPGMGLAPIVVDAVYERLRDIMESGRSMLLIEETVNRIHVADRVYLLHGGQVVTETDPRSFLAEHRFVESFFLGVRG